MQARWGGICADQHAFYFIIVLTLSSSLTVIVQGIAFLKMSLLITKLKTT